MSYIKKILAVVLILAMTLGLVLEAGAAGSPTEGYDPATDTYTEKSGTTTVTTKVGEKAVEKVESGEASVTLATSKDAKGQEIQIEQIGDGTDGVFDSAEGRKVTKVTTASKAAQIILAANAFKGSSVKTVVIGSRKTKIRANAFGDAKNITLDCRKSTRQAQLKFEKGSLKGVKKIILSKKLSKSSRAKVLKKLKAAGFTGKVSYK